MTNRIYIFVRGDRGTWRVVWADAVTGLPLERVPRLEVIEGKLDALPEGGKWLFCGVTSHERYVTRAERGSLNARQQGLRCLEATLRRPRAGDRQR